MDVRKLRVFGIALIAIGTLVACAESDDRWTYIERDARIGDADAQLQLGLRYLYGNDIPKDSVQAKHWLELSAAQHLAAGQYYLAQLYLAQHDAVSRAQALALLRAAHDGGESMADHSLAEILATSADGNREDGQFAVGLLETTLRDDTSADADDFEVLAAAYARAGRFAEAVGAQRHAVSDEDCSCNKELLRQRERRLETYQRGETWNEAL